MGETVYLNWQVRHQAGDEAKVKGILGELASGGATAGRNLGGIEREAKRASSGIAGMAGSLKGLLVAAGAVTALYKGFSLLSESLKLYGVQEGAIAQVEARIKSTGGAAGQTSEQLQRIASSLQGVTTIGDEATLEMQALLLAFTKIKGDEFELATERVLDMSQAMGTDLKSSAIQVGKALNDPIRGISALSRAGVQFSESQRASIKSLVEMGDTAGAQRVILQELETQFGGAARAARETLPGALTAAGNALGDVQEEIGKGLAPTIAFLAERLATLAADPAFMELARSAGEGIATMIRWTIMGAAAIGQFAADGIKRIREWSLTVIDIADSTYAAFERGAQFLGPFGAQLRESIGQMRGVLAENRTRMEGFGVDVEAGLRQGVDAALDLAVGLEGVGKAAGGATAPVWTMADGTDEAADAADKLRKALERQTASLEEQAKQIKIRIAALGKGEEAERDAERQIVARNAAIQAGLQPGAAAAAGIEALAKAVFDLGKREEDLKDKIEKGNKGMVARITALRDAAKETIALARNQRDAVLDLEAQVASELRLEAAARLGADALRAQMIEEELMAFARANGIKGETEYEQAILKRARAAITAGIGAPGGSNNLSEWATSAREFSKHLQGVDDEFAEVINSAADFLDALQNINAEGGKLGAIVAGADLVRSVGNQMTGGNNYGAEGAMVGAIVGAIIGGPSGMAIGSAIGGAIGSLIGKSSDQFLGSIEESAGRAMGRGQWAVKAGGVIGAQFMSQVTRGINAAIDAIGGELGALPGIEVHVKDGIFSVFAAGMRAKFGSMAEAVDFAILYALQNSEITGISDNVRSVLERTTAENFQNLAADLDFAKWVDALPEIGRLASESGRAVVDAVEQYRIAFRRAVELGIDTAKIDQALGASLEALRNNLLGIVETDEERIRREAAGFNEKVAMIAAEQKMREAELLGKKAGLEAEIALVQAEMATEEYRLRARGAFVQGQAALVTTEVKLLGALMEALAAVDAALAVAQGILGGLPGLISEGDIQDAIRRARRGAAGAGGRDERAELVSRLVDVERAALDDFDRMLLEHGEKWEREIELAQRHGIELERVAAARQLEVDAIAQSIRDRVQGLRGGSGNDLADERRRILDEFAEIRRQNELLLEQEGQLAMARWKINEAERVALQRLAEDVISGLGLPMEATRSQVETLKQQLQLLWQSVADGAITGERLKEVYDQLKESTASQLYGLAAGILDSMGASQEAAQMRAYLEEANFHMQRAQLTFLFEQYMALGLISDEVAERMREVFNFINNEENWPDFTVPAYSPPPPPPPPAPTTSLGDPASDLERIRRQVLDQIQAWEDLSLTPNERRLAELNRRIEEMNQLALEAGMSLEEQNRLQAAAQLAIEDFWRGVTDPIRDFYDSMGLSQFSPAGGRERLGQAQSEFDSLVARLQADPNDLGALEQLTGAAQTLLQQAQSFTGGQGPLYSRIFNQVQQMLAGVLGIAPQVTLGAGSRADLGNVIGGAQMFTGAGLGSGPIGNGGFAARDVSDPIVDAINGMSRALVPFLRDVAANTETTADEVARTRQAARKPVPAPAWQRDAAVAFASAKRERVS